ncbi:MAG TPA: VanZ family protein [Clostridiales bacterium]|nr:VanZ family protein [Clostridiales bacterium]
MRKNKKSAAKFLWAAVIIWMAVIFFFSAQSGEQSSALSGGISEKLSNLMSPLIESLNWDTAKFEAGLESSLRNLAHCTIFFVLGVLLALTMQCYNISMPKRFLFSFFISLAYAVSDEIHQIFVPGRAFQLSDIAIDTAGALVGILLVVLVFRSRTNKKKGKKA